MVTERVDEMKMNIEKLKEGLFWILFVAAPISVFIGIKCQENGHSPFWGTLYGGFFGAFMPVNGLFERKEKHE